MTPLTLTVHRATHQIGGNCIELRSGEDRLVLDVGRPLDAPSIAEGLLPESLDLSGSPAHVLISHPHQDHYGLLCELPASWPVYATIGSARLMRLTSRLFRAELAQSIRLMASGEAEQIGSFRVTPFLTDHSAFDAHMLLIEAAGKRVLYTGDFRRHGRKAKLVDRMIAAPPTDVDVLLMEGTNLGSHKPSCTEIDLETDFASLFRETPGRVFVAWSAQNIDRTVTLYRAALKAGRTLVIDLYTAEVLEALADLAKLPQPDWPNVKVVVTSSLARMYRRRGDESFISRLATNGISARGLQSHRERWVIMVRPSLARDYARAGVFPTSEDAWSFSQWSGYLEAADGRELSAWFESGRARAAHIHTSGHASPADLRAFASAVAPRWLVPIHGVAWDAETEGFPAIRRLVDGELIEI